MAEEVIKEAITVRAWRQDRANARNGTHDLAQAGTVVAGNQPDCAKCLIISLDDLSSCGDGQLSEGAVSIELDMPLAIQDRDESDDHSTDHSANDFHCHINSSKGEENQSTITS